MSDLARQAVMMAFSAKVQTGLAGEDRTTGSKTAFELEAVGRLFSPGNPWANFKYSPELPKCSFQEKVTAGEINYCTRSQRLVRKAGFWV
jgi:hypothetical protein